MKNCFLVAVFWRDNGRVISTVRVCNEGQAMSERMCRGMAETVEGRMKLADADLYYPEVNNQIEFVELYLVNTSIISTLNTVELWHRNFRDAIATSDLVLVTAVSLEHRP